MSDKPTAKRRRGRPRKSGDQLRRGKAHAALDNLQVWFMVESKRKVAAGMSLTRICELIVKEAIQRREAAPRAAQEMLDLYHKYLFNAGTLRRRYTRAETLRRRDRTVADYCARELEKIPPWSTRPRRAFKES